MTVTADAFAEAWPAAVRHRGAPVSEASDIPMLLLARTAQGGVKMVLTGEGADELLAGYPKHQAERWIGGYHAMVPPVLHRRLSAPLVRRLPYEARRWKILSRALGVGDALGRARLWFANGEPGAAAELLGHSQSEGRPPSASRLSAFAR